ncbi:hypothetical protein [uncultured Eubacterium sp.]|uniref:hypothetical protein n=1 Tax=uncultured Eubacterium sp. TaxID=165185 RepID=UPI0025EBD6F2|nr:hypothetical protein [uncultured Eubacterium sp.]
MATVKCDKCGKEIIIDETRSFGFCSFCGAKISCNQTTLNNLFDNSIYNNDIEREFLISNITNIKNLHYISNNFQDNIDCLENRKNDFAYKKEPELPQKPVCETKSKIDILGEMIAGMFEIPIIGFFIALFNCLIENKENKEKYEKELLEYNENIEHYYKDIKLIKTENEKRNKAITNLEKAKNDLQAENKEALKLLEECYDINIIPSKYRNIYAITFIYDYLTTSQGTLRDALFACDLDKIQIQLDKVIKNQQNMICKLAKIEANSEKQLKNQQTMISHLENIEKNTYDTARTSEQCAQYGKIIAHNTKVMAYCSAMTYIETNDIANYDPYAPGTIRDFGLERFSSYYKD